MSNLRTPQALTLVSQLQNKYERFFKSIEASILINHGVYNSKFVITIKSYDCSYCNRSIKAGEVTLTGSGRQGTQRTHICTDCIDKVANLVSGEERELVYLRAYMSSSDGEY